MALFKFRLPGQGEAAPEGRRRAGAATNVRKSQAAPTESVESLRQRARHRVIGASVLVVAAVIGFPMLFDSEPRPVDVNVPIAIPDRDNAPPLHASAERVAAQDSLNDHEEVVTNDPAPVVVPPVRSSTSSAERSAVNAEAAAQAERDRAAQAAKDKAEQERAAKAAHEREARDKAAKEKAAKEKAAKDKAAKEKAAKERADRAEKEKAERAERTERADKLAQEKAEREKREKREKAEKAAKDKAERLAKEKADKADKDKADTGRFVVQVGSFGEESKAKEARSKLERAGIATYIQVVETSEGKRTRVRVGPFGSRSEAEAAAKKVKALGLYSGIAEL